MNTLNLGAGKVFVILVCLAGVCSAQRRKPTDFCERGFQIAAKYHECWEQATAANPYGPLYKSHDVYDGLFVERYATHMCSVVKPEALECLRKEVSVCPNAQKLVDVADDSGGACTRNHLNPFFKLHIIDKLKPIKGGSPCFAIADRSYECYVAAGDELMSSGVRTVDINHFHKVADKFFDYIWTCLTDIFKANRDECHSNWQIPMLLSLQRTAMPSLFGMRLNNYQVNQLELGPATQDVDEQTRSQVKPKSEENKVYVLLRVSAEKPEKQEGDIVLEIDSSDNEKAEVGVIGGGEKAVDVNSFIAELMTGENQLTLHEIRQIKKEQNRKNKEIQRYLDQVKKAQERNKKKSWKQRKTGGKVKGKN